MFMREKSNFEQTAVENDLQYFTLRKTPLKTRHRFPSNSSEVLWRLKRSKARRKNFFRGAVFTLAAARRRPFNLRVQKRGGSAGELAQHRAD